MAEYGGVEEFFSKIANEGGIEGALSYGLTTDGYDLPEDAVSSWAALIEAWSSYDVSAKAFKDAFAPEGWDDMP